MITSAPLVHAPFMTSLRTCLPTTCHPQREVGAADLAELPGALCAAIGPRFSSRHPGRYGGRVAGRRPVFPKV